MNIQLYGSNKSADSRKAERYFKERKIPFQSIDLLRFGLSDREHETIKQAVGGVHAMIDPQSKAYQTLYIANQPNDAAVEQKLREHPELLRLPIVRNGKQATVGYQPDIWKEWK